MKCRKPIQHSVKLMKVGYSWRPSCKCSWVATTKKFSQQGNAYAYYLHAHVGWSAKEALDEGYKTFPLTKHSNAISPEYLSSLKKSY